MKTRKLIEINWIVLSLLCFLVILSIVIFYYIKYPSENAFGERYIQDEIPIIFPFYPIYSFKPMTLICYLGFLAWCFMLEGLRDVFYILGKKKLKFLFIIFAFFSFWVFYEILWNFHAWFAIWKMESGSLDFVSHDVNPSMKSKINFVYATKVIFMLFGMGVYTLYCIYRGLQVISIKKPITIIKHSP